MFTELLIYKLISDKIPQYNLSSLKQGIYKIEYNCNISMLSFFSDVEKYLKPDFPDLLTIFEAEKSKVADEISSYIHDYILSHTNELSSDEEKISNKEVEKFLGDTEKNLKAKLNECAKQMLDDITSKLNERIDAQKSSSDKRIMELETLKVEAETRIMELENMRDKAIISREIAGCISQLLNNDQDYK